jgi:hypothetical protein
MTPAPITTNFSGTLDKAKAPVEETKTFSSMVNPLGQEISDPVAIRIFSASITLTPP